MFRRHQDATPTTHTAEPWTLPVGVTEVDKVWDADGEREICVAYGPNADLDLRRIVACVNACQGIAHPEALPELIAALGALDNMLTSEFALGADKPIRDALAKLRGE